MSKKSLTKQKSLGWKVALYYTALIIAGFPLVIVPIIDLMHQPGGSVILELLFLLVGLWFIYFSMSNLKRKRPFTDLPLYVRILTLIPLALLLIAGVFVLFVFLALRNSNWTF